MKFIAAAALPDSARVQPASRRRKGEGAKTAAVVVAGDAPIEVSSSHKITNFFEPQELTGCTDAKVKKGLRKMGARDNDAILRRNATTALETAQKLSYDNLTRIIKDC